jgi:hypothetical protein
MTKILVNSLLCTLNHLNTISMDKLNLLRIDIILLMMHILERHFKNDHNNGYLHQYHHHRNKRISIITTKHCYMYHYRNCHRYHLHNHHYILYHHLTFSTIIVILLFEIYNLVNHLACAISIAFYCYNARLWE